MNFINREFDRFFPSGSVLGEMDVCIIDVVEVSKGFSKTSRKRKKTLTSISKKGKNNSCVWKFEKFQISELKISLTDLTVIFLMLYVVISNHFRMSSRLPHFTSNSPLWMQNQQPASISVGTRGFGSPISPKVQQDMNYFYTRKSELGKSDTNSKTVEFLTAPNFLGDVSRAELESKSRLLLGIGGNFDVQMNFRNRHSNTDFQEKLHQLGEKIGDLQATTDTLFEGIEKLRHEGETHDLLSIQNSHENIAKEFLDLLKETFAVELANCNCVQFGWTNKKALEANPEYSGLTVRDRQRQTHRLTRTRLQELFFYGKPQAYEKFQGALDSFVNLDDAIFKLDSQHKSILKARDNFNLSELKENVGSLESQFSEISANKVLKPAHDFITIQAPKTVSIQGYRKFAKIDLAASFSLDSKVSVGLGKCKLFPTCGFDHAGVLVGFDVGGSYTFSSKKFGPQAKIFVGLGTCF